MAESLHMNNSIADGIEEFDPGLADRLMEGYSDAEISLGGNCQKCGAEVRLTDQHVEWHRNLTLAMNYQTYKAALAFGLLDAIMSNVAERGVSLEELVAVAFNARQVGDPA